jgi:hypothetical protein
MANVSRACMKALITNNLTLICALAVFAFAAFALHVNLTPAAEPVSAIERAAH